MRVTKHSMYLQVLHLFNEMFIVVATPGEGTCSSVGSTRYTACALRWLGHHGEDELANPPKQRLFPDSRDWGVILMFVILFHRKIAMCGVFFFPFFLNAHLV